MKHLLLMRHAQAGSHIVDFDRPLTQYGQNQAKRIGEQLANEQLNFDLMLASDAMRCKQTATIVAEQIAYSNSKIQYRHHLYSASADDLFAMLLTFTANTPIIIGHNPSISQLANELAINPVAALQPADCVHLQIDIVNWSDLVYGKATHCKTLSIQY